MLRKVVSGYQTGADRVGVHAAYECSIETGGWIPKGCRAEDGKISLVDVDKYSLEETDDWRYQQRTEWNVRDSSATAIFGNHNSPGCKLTISCCKKYNRPYIKNPSSEKLLTWIGNNNITILNIAGNREETNPGIYQRTYDLLVKTFS